MSSGITGGVIQGSDGKQGTRFHENAVSACSLPFRGLDPPEGTGYLALVLEDKDAGPVTGGFP